MGGGREEKREDGKLVLVFDRDKGGVAAVRDKERLIPFTETPCTETNSLACQGLTETDKATLRPFQFLRNATFFVFRY